MVATKSDPICSKNALKNVDLHRTSSEATFEPPPLGLGAFLAGAQQWPPLARLQAFKSSQLRWNTDCSQKEKVYGGSGLVRSAASKRSFGGCAEYEIAWSC